MRKTGETSVARSRKSEAKLAPRYTNKWMLFNP